MKSGFTLIELVIVVIIIGILASVAIVLYSGKPVEKARSAEAYSVLSEIVHAEKVYFIENSAYTTNFSNLDTFTAAPGSDNFTFSIPSADTSAGYAQAARKLSGSGQLSYGMCLDSGKRASCDAATCNPGCP